MTQLLWRIATDTRDYEADDLSGKGAEISGGRWNREGMPLVYTASTRALACLETIVHLNTGGLPLNRYLVQVEVPSDVWAKAETLDVTAHIGWDAEPYGRKSLDLGTDWVKKRSSAILQVPSVIVPEEWNALINPQHPDATMVTAKKMRKWLYDPRLART